MSVGLVGVGMMGQQHLRSYAHVESASLKGIYDGNVEASNRIADENGLICFNSFESMLNDPEVDIIDLCLPTFLHEEFIIKAVNSSKNVICEKPLSLSLESAKRIKNAVSSKNVKFMVAQVMRFWPEYRAIKSIIDANKLGKIEKVRTYRLSEPPVWGNWFLDPKKGGGALYDLHIHDMDYVYSVFGMPESVSSTGNKGEQGAWDSVVTVIEYPGYSVVIEADYRYPKGWPFTFGFHARGDSAAVDYSFSVNGNVDTESGQSSSLTLFTDGKREDVNLEYTTDGYTAELEYFCRCVRDNKPIDWATIEDAVEVIELITYESESLLTGKKIYLRGEK